MRIKSSVLLAFLIVPAVVYCQPTESDFKAAKTLVLTYFEIAANHLTGSLWSIKEFKNIMHPDFVSLGTEGFRKSVIKDSILIVSVKQTNGNFSHENPHEETAIEVIATVTQTFSIDGIRAKKEPKKYDIRFILSNFNQPPNKYLILDVVSDNYADVVYETALKSALRKDGAASSVALRKSLITAGMTELLE